MKWKNIKKKPKTEVVEEPNKPEVKQEVKQEIEPEFKPEFLKKKSC